ncbi:hypothetical protein AVEN_95702-1 [Araneus ventricosus]|uniref:Uncharacterized protein n=1 Tax=Araneus ventricosus TaxID=182803 RepID=A0A4Y2QUG3_ARAVE|nr:hypothetical protein AVEN_95702-1 [Araneus ventricosus]
MLHRTVLISEDFKCMWTYFMQSNATDNYEDSSLCLLHQEMNIGFLSHRPFIHFFPETIFKVYWEFGKTASEYDIHRRTGAILAEGSRLQGNTLFQKCDDCWKETKIVLIELKIENRIFYIISTNL